MHAEFMVTAIKEDKGIGRNVMTKVRRGGGG